METEINFECVVLIISLAVFACIWIDRCYRFKMRERELAHEKQIAELRQQNMLLSRMIDIVQSSATSNGVIVKAWIGREKIEKEQKDSGSKPKKQPCSN